MALLYIRYDHKEGKQVYFFSIISEHLLIQFKNEPDTLIVDAKKIYLYKGTTKLFNKGGGEKTMGPKHIIVLRDGETLMGEIMNNKEFVIKTSYAELTFSIDKIANIHFKNPPQYLNDEMLTTTQDTLKGDIIFNDPVIIKLDASGQSVNIEKNKIHTIMFLIC